MGSGAHDQLGLRRDAGGSDRQIAEGKIVAFLDWENCTSNLAPAWELSISLHDLTIDEKQLFLEGYGLKEKQVIEVMPVVKAINLINYAPEIEASAYFIVAEALTNVAKYAKAAEEPGRVLGERAVVPAGTLALSALAFTA